MPVLQRLDGKIHAEAYGHGYPIRLPGTDKPHPAVTSAEFATLLPGIEVLENRRGPGHLDGQLRRVLAFLDPHTPKEMRAKAA
jgi:hypothetical protein